MCNYLIKEANMKVFVSKLKSKLISIITDLNKMKAIYLLWVMLHFILLFVCGNFRPSIDNFCGCEQWAMKCFSPFECYYFVYYTGYPTYDISEFLIYISFPVCLYYAGKLWFKGKK
jgi:hypothetical protein